MTIDHGEQIVSQSWKFVAMHKRVLLYMSLAAVLTVLLLACQSYEIPILEISLGSLVTFLHVPIDGPLDLLFFNIAYFISVLFIVPLVYHVYTIKKRDENSILRTMSMLFSPHCIAALGCYIVFSFLILRCAPSLIALIGMPILYWTSIVLLSCIYFFISIVFDLMVISVVVDKVNVIEAFKHAFTMIKRTMPVLIMGSMLILAFIVITATFSAVITYFSILLTQDQFFITAIIGAGVILIFGIIYKTVAITFETLLYLAYTESQEVKTSD